MKNETLYELLKNFEDPNGSVYAGTRKTKQQWMARFALLNPNDCDIKTDWFKKVDEQISNVDTIGNKIKHIKEFIYWLENNSAHRIDRDWISRYIESRKCY